ncbi:MAG: 16S rRNA (cytidine(1402)-2'-O)-methyltransferase [Elusimicrobiota bacterium]
MLGPLFVVATPIGNLDDLTRRAEATLKLVDFIACEDTRRTEKLLHHLGISKPLLRYDEHSHGTSSKIIIDRLKLGQKGALVTDAGTPAISDPGSRLIEALVKENISVVPIPGVSSVVTLLSVSGLTSEGFVFLGFLPRKPGPAKRLLQEAFGLGKNTVIFESPFRVEKTLTLIEECVPTARVVLGRELTKLFEEYMRGSPSEVKNKWTHGQQKGEVVLVIHPE